MLKSVENSDKLLIWLHAGRSDMKLLHLVGDGWMDGWMDGWIDGWVDGWMDGWMVHLRQRLSEIQQFQRKSGNTFDW